MLVFEHFQHGFSHYKYEIPLFEGSGSLVLRNFARANGRTVRLAGRLVWNQNWAFLELLRSKMPPKSQKSLLGQGIWHANLLKFKTLDSRKDSGFWSFLSKSWIFPSLQSFEFHAQNARLRAFQHLQNAKIRRILAKTTPSLQGAPPFMARRPIKGNIKLPFNPFPRDFKANLHFMCRFALQIYRHAIDLAKIHDFSRILALKNKNGIPLPLN